MNRIASKRREKPLLDILADVAKGALKGKQLTAYDVSAMGSPPAIQLDGDEEGSATYVGSLTDREHLAHEGYIEADQMGASLRVTVLPAAEKYRDELRAIEIAKGQTPKA